MDIGENRNEIQKVEAYIEKYGPPYNYRFDTNMRELLALTYGLDHIEGVMLAFRYGRAKAWQQAKKELRQKSA